MLSTMPVKKSTMGWKKAFTARTTVRKALGMVSVKNM